MKITGIHRVELLVEDPATVADTFNELFDISFSHDPDTADHGTKCYMAAEAGLELVAPTKPDNTPAQILKEKGEGLLTIVLKVENMDDAKVWAKEKGIGIVYDAEFPCKHSPGVWKQLSLDRNATHGFMITLIEEVYE